MARTDQQKRDLFDQWAQTYASDMQTGIGIRSGVHSGINEVSGVDVSPRIMERCAEQHPDCHLSEGSFTRIPLPSQRFDVAISSFTFHEVATNERDRAVSEVKRVLKPGGVFCLLDILFASDSARDEARQKLGREWDDEEYYARIEEVDTLRRRSGFVGPQWRQTAPCHWFVVARSANN